MTGLNCLALEANRGGPAQTVFTIPNGTEQSNESAKQQECSGRKLLYKQGASPSEDDHRRELYKQKYPMRKLSMRAILQAKNIP